MILSFLTVKRGFVCTNLSAFKISILFRYYLLTQQGATQQFLLSLFQELFFLSTTATLNLQPSISSPGYVTTGAKGPTKTREVKQWGISCGRVSRGLSECKERSFTSLLCCFLYEFSSSLTVDGQWHEWMLNGQKAVQNKFLSPQDGASSLF